MKTSMNTSRVHVAAVSLKGFRQDGGGHLAKAKSGGAETEMKDGYLIRRALGRSFRLGVHKFQTD